jgi:phosphoglycolate phosphatase-like HAD superfamily hydrolase
MALEAERPFDMEHGMLIYALDFDGVICDSAAETGETAWRAGCEIWPEWGDRSVPEAVLERFRSLRPVLETGYQSLGLMRLAETDPAAVGSEELAVQANRMLLETGRSRSALVDMFGQARDRWLAEDLAGWLARHSFYPGILDALKQFMARGEVFILTTKQERFVKALLQGQGVDFPDERLYGLEDGRCKEEILLDLLARYPQNECLFVEDRLETLKRVAVCPALGSVQLYLATWGYNTASTRGEGARHRRIHLLELADFASLGLR